MKAKLNLTINSNLIPRSKVFAKKKGKSVSQLVEDLLTKVLEEEKKSFSSKWLGKLKITDTTNERTKYLNKRYQL